MTNTIRKLVTRHLRRVPSTLCLLALAMQVALPVLHGWNEPSHDVASLVSEGATTFEAAADHGVTEGHHNAATCPQCRLVSQLKTLSPFGQLAHVPVLRTAWIAASAPAVACSLAARASGAPRAPPLLA